MLSTTVARALRERGFGSAATRCSGERALAGRSFTFRRAKSVRDHVSFTINLGVNFVELQRPDEGPPSRGPAHVQNRIGSLLSGSQDVWVKIDSRSDLAAVAREVVDAIDRAAIPWLERPAVLDEVVACARADAKFIEPWHLSRLRVLADRVDRPGLATELLELAQLQAI
jgi:hypothetical protein